MISSLTIHNPTLIPVQTKRNVEEYHLPTHSLWLQLSSMYKAHECRRKQIAAWAKESGAATPGKSLQGAARKNPEHSTDNAQEGEVKQSNSFKRCPKLQSLESEFSKYIHLIVSICV